MRYLLILIIFIAMTSCSKEVIEPEKGIYISDGQISIGNHNPLIELKVYGNVGLTTTEPKEKFYLNTDKK